MLSSQFVSYWFVTPSLLFNNLDAEYDYGNSDDDSGVDSDYYSDYINSWLIEYSQCKEYKNDQHIEL